ncbi:MAG: DNA internalization-related competence protein ComEC/Rec2 [Bacillota bacterium]
MQRESVLLYAVVLFCVGAAMMDIWGKLFAWALGVCLAATICWPVCRRCAQGLPQDLRRLASLCTGTMLAGAMVMAVSTLPRPCDRAFAQYASSRAFDFTGVVTGFPEATSDSRWRAVVKVEEIGGDRRPAGVHLLITGKQGRTDEGPFLPGARVRVRGRFYPPRAPANPGEPDMRVILRRQGISGTVYVRSPDDVHLLGTADLGILVRAATSLRGRITAVTRATLEPHHAAILCGMLFGSPPSGMEEKLQATGTSHLFAVSGLHVGFIAVVLYGLFSALRLPVSAAATFVAAGVWIYALGCGLRPSVVRAALMFSFAVAAGVSGRKVSARSALYLAGLVMAAASPLSVFDAGAQLSFAVVYSILQFAPRIERALRRLPVPFARAFAVSLSTQIGAMPLVAWYFGRIAPIAAIANIPCVTMSGIAVTIGFSAGLAGAVCRALAFPLNAANALILSALEGTIDLLSRVPFGSITVARPPLWLVLVCYLALVLLGCSRRVLRRIHAARRHLPLLMAVIAAAAVWIAVLKPAFLETVFLSVGQGDSVFLRSPSGRTVLVDGGGWPGADQDPGSEVVVPFLLRRGVRRLDVVVGTHPHYDHISGLMAVLKSCRVGVLVKPALPQSVRPNIDRELDRLAAERNVRVLEMVKGGFIDLGDGVRINVLHPPQDFGDHSSQDLNDWSLVMKLTLGGFGVLLTGDAGGEILSHLAGNRLDLRCAVFKVPHHGAARGCPGSVLPVISATWAVVSVGPNPFGHPAGTTISALHRAGMRVLRTDIDGAVTVISDGRRVVVRSALGRMEKPAKRASPRKESGLHG